MVMYYFKSMQLLTAYDVSHENSLFFVCSHYKREEIAIIECISLPRNLDNACNNS